MRFLHAADLHLGLRVTRFGADVNGRIQEARLKALEVMIDEAKARAVDFVLIAGDLFDDNQVDLATSRRAYEMLQAAGRPVYIIPGNHDPLTADSVFARLPWNAIVDGCVRVLRSAEAIPIPGGVLFPGPLFAKNSLDDPMRWIPPRAAGDTAIRIGLGHGSLNDRPNLSPDDHLIAADTAESRGLDYLALGHWHGFYSHADDAGVVRTAYPGVHEPMGFRDSPTYSIGWSAYSTAGSPDLFTGDGQGRVLDVTLSSAGAAPRIDPIATGRFQWRDESYTLRDEASLSTLIDQLAHREQQENQLLRLHLTGTLPARAMIRLDELDASRGGGQGGILSRYRWAELDVSRLYSEPDDAELQNRAGEGVVRQVYERLKLEASDPDVSVQERAREAMLLLYRFAQEAVP